MITRVRRFWRRLSMMLRAEKTWHLPRRSDVLLFDACNQHLLEEYLAPWQPEVLHVRGEAFNVPVLLRSLGRPGRRTETYIDAYIAAVKPRLIVTFIDNAETFLALKSRHPGITTMFVQNGWRGHYADIFDTLDGMDPERRRRLHVDRMLTFGSVIGAHYRRYVGGNSVAIGCLKNNMIPRVQPTHRDLMVFLSQWLPDGLPMAGKFVTQETFFGGDKLILEVCGNYADQHGKRFEVVPRTRRADPLRSQEAAFFSRLLGSKFRFLEPEGSFPSYSAIDMAEVVIAVDTTLGYEALARGKRTAMFSVRGHALELDGLTFGWPGDFADEGPFWTNRPDPDTYTRILDHLFTVTDAQWRSDIEMTGFQSLMIHDPGNSVLKAVLANELGAMTQKLVS